MSFEEFVECVRSDVSREIQRTNEDVEEQLPEILDVKRVNRQRSLLLDPNGARRHIKGLMEKQEAVDRFLDVVTGVRGEKVQITTVVDGHRQDRRDKILKAKDPHTGEDLMDYRLLMGDPKRRGEDIRNEASSHAFYKLLKLPVYPEKAVLRRRE
jgi:hypothetical protein